MGRRTPGFAPSVSFTLEEHVQSRTCPPAVLLAAALLAAAVPPPAVDAQAPPATPAGTRAVTGRVTDAATGEGIPGAQISIGTTTALGITRDDGSFTVRVPAGAVTLVVRRIGYRRAEARVAAGAASVAVPLQKDLLRLSEVVVTGQATGIERRNAATAIASVNAEDLNRAPAASVENMLAGRVAGADVQMNSGAPGGGNQIRLRGISTVIGGATPLYVVDGVIVSDVAIPPGVFAITGSSANPVVGGRQDNASNRIADLDPNTIERVEILKGATAAAIYGSRANNGVVLITTKRGQIGAPRVSLVQRLGTFQVLNTIGLRRFESREDAVATFGPAVGALWQPGAYFDHEQEVYGERPLAWETILGLNGGTETTRYNLSGLLKDDGGIIANTGYRKQSITSGLDQLFGDRVSVRVTANALSTRTGRGFTNNDNRGVALGQALARSPSFVDLRRRADGTFPTNPAAQSNPLQTAALSRNDEVVYRFIGSGNVSYDALRSARQTLKLVANGGTDFFNQRSNIYSPPDLQFEPLDGLPGTAVRSNAQNLNMNVNVGAVHTWRSAGGGVQATTSLGHQYEQRGLDNTRVVAQNLIGGLDNVGRGTAVSVAQDVAKTRDVGIYLQEELLAFGERLFVSGGFRADRSSNNSDPQRYYYFPRASASWRFPAMPGALDELKLRAAVGRSGNQPVFGQSFTEFLGANIAGLPTIEIGPGAQVAASDLRPEIQNEFESGADLTAFGGRAALEVSWYQKTISDLLVTGTLANSTGFGLRIFNGGQVRTRGAEAGLRLVPVTGDRVEWRSNTTFSTDRSRVLALTVPPFQPPGFGTTFGVFQVEAGRSLTQIVGNDSLPNGQGVVRQVGDAIPDFRMGFNNTLRLGRIDVSSLVDWQQGGEIINLTRYLWDLSRNGPDCNQVAAAPNPTNETVCARRIRTFARQTRNYIEDASFVKVREISLSYVVPSRLVKSLWSRADAARVTLAGRNLFVFTDYTGLDPEVSNFGSQAVSRGFDVSPYPPSRAFWFSVDVGF